MLIMLNIHGVKFGLYFYISVTQSYVIVTSFPHVLYCKSLLLDSCNALPGKIKITALFNWNTQSDLR